MQLKVWEKNGLVRIYIDDAPGSTGQVFLTLTRGKMRVGGDVDDELAVMDAVKTKCGLHGSDDAAVFAAALALSRSTAPRHRAARTTPAAGYQGGSGMGGYQSPAPSGADLVFENICNETEVLIEVDHREPAQIDAMIARAPNTKVVRAHLPIGDYRINGVILVERKSTRDFANSVQSGHLFDQAQRIGIEPDVVGMVVLEGDLFGGKIGMLKSQITGAISCLFLVQGMSVINTADLEHTAYALAKLGQHNANGLGYALTLRKDKPKKLLDAQRFVLEGLNGINCNMADTLLKHFGSVRAVINADYEQLVAVRGIGPKRAASIIEVLTKSY